MYLDLKVENLSKIVCEYRPMVRIRKESWAIFYGFSDLNIYEHNE